MITTISNDPPLAATTARGEPSLKLHLFSSMQLHFRMEKEVSNQDNKDTDLRVRLQSEEIALEKPTMPVEKISSIMTDFNNEGPKSRPVKNIDVSETDRSPNIKAECINDTNDYLSDRTIQTPPKGSNTTCKVVSEINDQWIFMDTVPDFMKCKICSNIFESPQLLSCCGTENICKKCMDRYLQRLATLADQQPSCPFCRSIEFKLINNAALEQTINLLKVQCCYQHKGCGWTGILENGDLHLKECDFVPIDCPNGCGYPKFERGKLHTHVTMCPLQYISCPFQAVGCDSEFLRTEQSQRHAVGNLHQHLLLIAQENSKVSSECESTSILRNTIHEGSVKENADMICSQKGILESLKLAMKSLADSLFKTRRKIDSLKLKLATEKNYLAKLERTNEEAENTNACFKATIEDVKALPVPKAIDLEIAYPVRPILFSINDFMKRIAINTMWMSRPFYTHKGGYKMHFFLYPGHETNHGKYVSIGLRLMSGEYDDHLKWPFPGVIITLTAINRQRMNNKSQHFELVGENRRFDDNLTCRLKPYLNHGLLPSFLDDKDCLELKLYRIQFLPL